MRVLIPCAVALLALGPSQTPPAAPAVNIQTLGPQVGQRAPDFALTDQQGAQRTLKSVLGPKGAMIVFFRSADW